MPLPGNGGKFVGGGKFGAHGQGVHCGNDGCWFGIPNGFGENDDDCGGGKELS